MDGSSGSAGIAAGVRGPRAHCKSGLERLRLRVADVAALAQLGFHARPMKGMKPSRRAPRGKTPGPDAPSEGAAPLGPVRATPADHEVAHTDVAADLAPTVGRNLR